MNAQPSFWRQLLAALTHHGPGYDTPTATERHAEARITFALAHCDRIERELSGRHTVPTRDALLDIRCIRSALNPDGD